MLLGSTKTWGARKLPSEKETTSWEGQAVEWCCLLFMLCLIYKLAYLGIGILLLIGLLGLFLRNSAPLPLSFTSLSGVAYVVLVSFASFQTGVTEGVYRSAQGLLVLWAGFVAVKHFRQCPAAQVEAFVRKLTLLAIAVFLHAVYYHVASGRYMGWKMLYDTKITFSLLTVLLFAQENEIRRRVAAAGWWTLMAGFGGLILLSGERKAYIAFVILFFLSGTRVPAKVMVAGAGAAALMLYLMASPEGYLGQQLGSLLQPKQEITDAELYATQDIGYNSDLVREFVNRNARRQFLAHPLLGLGTTGYQKWANKNFRGIGLGFSNNVHGEVNRIPVENGLLGITLALAYVFLTARRVLLYSGKNDGALSESRKKLPVYIMIFMWCYLATEALNTLMLAAILLFGFYAAEQGRTKKRLSFRGMLTGKAAT